MYIYLCIVYIYLYDFRVYKKLFTNDIPFIYIYCEEIIHFQLNKKATIPRIVTKRTNSLIYNPLGFLLNFVTVFFV